MNFKSLILILFLLILVLLLLQNSATIPIIILGSAPINIPLSIILFSAFLGGILSTLIIKFLINLSTPKTNNYSKRNYNIPNEPPPSTDSQYSRKIEEKYHPNYQPRYQDEPIYPPEPEIEPNKSPKVDLNPFEYNQPLGEFYENNEPIQKPAKNFTQEDNLSKKEDDFDDFIEEKVEQEKTIDIPPEKLIDQEEKTIDIPPEKEIIELEESEQEIKPKTRQAAPYSYQPRERTEIIPKSAKIPPRQQPNPRPSQGGIYDATYRVITPAYDVDEDLDNFDNEDEDWDF
ncbi:hypothetical protein Cyast_0597 [Cyanobacterium stanieri PCC 7202]|uniref:Lipopolysaccharide assembly protein A domain-containing protein n=1 Tax=Cyanobacterium stanieri (strain ATCC 29140 / PCC 7202) TaxID=292563 RepID=K9YI86_CYASC|nr:hypothetical protein Cyast_0597 [Cyanobacterium stanieri PCC 7202]